MITIIIPSFGQAEFLMDAIESAIDQTVKAEIIVVDDGSTDGSLEIAQKYPVKVISQVNKGLASARNAGIMNATGEYVLPLDADDILLPECVEEMTKAIQDTDADVIAPSFKQFGVWNSEVILDPNVKIDQFLTDNRIGYFSAIKKEALLEVGGYNPKMIFGWEDWDLWIDLFKRGKSLCVIQKPLVLYRTKENSMFRESIKHSQELLGQIRRNHNELFS